MTDIEDTYTPTTEEIRDAYVYERVANGMGVPRPVAEAEFYRWLATHDAGIRATEESTL